MQIQLNTDHHVTGSPALASRLEAEVDAALARFADRITRVEAHVNDVNSNKSGGDDKRCVMEARIAGREPIAATHQAESIGLAIAGAAAKLARALDRLFGKEQAERRNGGT